MPCELKSRFLLLYASQTGQAQAISEEIETNSEQYGLTCDRFCLSLTEKKFNIEREKYVVFVCSTTGEGEPPETACKFFRRLKKKTLPRDHLKHLQYSVLGLGDSNYSNFCEFGKNLDRRLRELGAQPFYPCAWADDAVGLEVAVEPWMEGLYPAVNQMLQPEGQEHGDATEKRTNPGMMDKIESANFVNVLADGEVMLMQNCTSASGAKDHITNDRSIPQVAVMEQVDNIDETLRLTSLEQSVSGLGLESSSEALSENGASHSLLNSSQLLQEVSCKADSSQQVSLQVSSLLKSSQPLCDATLTLPSAPLAYLDITYHHGNALDTASLPLDGGCPYPFATSPVSMATAVKASQLTSDDAFKKCLQVELSIADTGLTYRAGDSLSIVCPANQQEVEYLIDRLELSEMADVPCSFSVQSVSKKKNAAVPPFVPTPCTLRHVLTFCFDIRAVPKKSFLRLLSEYTLDALERRRLQELSSRQGADDFTHAIREASVSVVGLLAAFPSCKPPVERILENLPRLLPRPYSAASSPLVSPGVFKFLFNVVHLPSDTRGDRKGLCTGWLERMVDENALPMQIPVFSRSHQSFHLPDNPATPIIMIGPGTGLAPFIGFLQERSYHLQQETAGLGEAWLFYGCRHQQKDYLYRIELEDYLSSSVLTKLCVSFSRDDQPDGNPRYVQDNLKFHASGINLLIRQKGAVVYVCGDAKNMAKDVNAAFVDIFTTVSDMTHEAATSYLTSLRREHRYLEDIWT